MFLNVHTKKAETAVFNVFLELCYSSKEKLPEGLMHRCCSRITSTKKGFNTLLTRSKSVNLTAQGAKV